MKIDLGELDPAVELGAMMDFDLFSKFHPVVATKIRFPLKVGGVKFSGRLLGEWDDVRLPNWFVPPTSW
ncbi:MAG: hypothetical protein HQM08_22885 [Candidatus Riflebacteria bacterium]|nr:hypothetical protein [Candidatus Riflebacteria bacterium]